MSNIPLHPKRGLDPHRTYCPRCGGDTNELTIGVIEEGIFPTGHRMFVNKGQRHKLRQFARDLGVGWHDIKWREVEEHERLPASQPCDECVKEYNEHMEIVKKGGVFWRCTKCNQRGIIRPSAFAARARSIMQIPAPEPCGVEFDDCTQHSIDSNDEDDDNGNS